MKISEFHNMALDDLWILQERISAILERKLESERNILQDQLDKLGRKSSGSPSDFPQRRPYPKVQPKFQNPNAPFETWAGRGKRPRWVSQLLATGRNIDDFKINKRSLQPDAEREIVHAAESRMADL